MLEKFKLYVLNLKDIERGQKYLSATVLSLESL